MSATVTLLIRHNRNSFYGGIGLIIVIVSIVLSKNLPIEYQLPFAVAALIVLIVSVGLMTFKYNYDARGDLCLILLASQFDDPPCLWYKESIESEEIAIEGKDNRNHRILRLTQETDFSWLYGGDRRLEHCIDVVFQYWGNWEERIGLHDGYATRGGVPVGLPSVDMVFVDILPSQTFKDDDGLVKTFPVFELLFTVGKDQKIMRYAIELFWACRRYLLEGSVKSEKLLRQEFEDYVLRYRRLKEEQIKA